jgi:UDP-N-acetylmuramoyl-tripeptide--D-alanyl-D-alanine ligase
MKAAPLATLGTLAALLPGARRLGDAATPITRVHSDSRSVQPGDLFVALRGERFDGHDYLASARAAGAAAALAEQGLQAAGLAGLEVADSLQALQQLAAGWRAGFTLPLAVVVGSNGKTTVTQMVAACLRAAHGEAAFATRGNLNNHIGLPLTLLALRPGHRAGVVELGTNHPGEIAQLARLAAPTVVLVNNAQREHQEFLDGLEAVAVENGSAIAALPVDGRVVLPAADAMLPLWRRLAGARAVTTFALDDGSDAAGPAVAGEHPLVGRARWQGAAWALELHTPQGRVETTVPVAGRHNALNAVAAAACALELGVPPQAVAQGLAAFQPVAGRSRTLALNWQGRAATLVDDAYNANPDSVIAAIDVLATLPAPRWLLLGDMAEVGQQGPAFHAEVGRHAAAAGLDAVWTAGAASAVAAAECGARARHFERVEELLLALPQGPAAASVLVKGSRSMRMERVVQALQGAGGTGDAA